ncbi:acyltransferase family protein [Nostocoides veronense]|uniref:Acyltransferase family protein n=1 Tax=Nostocoides veronense TaxID=330836 RepID=A0ABN2LGD8_9MICO
MWPVSTPASTRPADAGARPTRAAQHRSLRYRPGLDGLRAIAVASVFLFHARPGVLPGGWLGVDIFFVLSGFLITSVLLTDRERHGRIDLTDFWLARARRLLPAVVLVLLAVVSAAYFWTVPARRQAITGDAIASWFYFANWHFLGGDEAYFAAVANPSPLRHMWSLAVEEQFYLLYPLLLVALIAVLGRTRRLTAALGGLAVASAVLMAALHTPGLDPSRVYYGTDTRAQQLITGAAVATLLAPGSPVTKRTRIAIDTWGRALSIPALLVLLLAFRFVRESTEGIFEGGLFALAVVTVLVVIAVASPNSSPVQRALSWAPLRHLGMISYGVYLWHWPVIVFLGADRMGFGGWPLTLAQAAITLALSEASYRLVEHPIRRGGLAALMPQRPRVGGVAAVTSLSVLALLIGLLPNSTTGSSGGSQGGALTWAAPAYQPGATQKRILLLGNSIPYSLARFYPAGEFPDLIVDQDTNFGCDMFADPKVVDGQVQPTTPACRDWRASWPTTVAAHRPDLAVIFLTHPMLDDIEIDGQVVPAGDARHTAYLQESLDQMARAAREAGAAKVAVMNLGCHRLPNVAQTSELTRTNDDAAVAALNAVAAQWGQRTGTTVFDQFGFLCSGGYHDMINGIPLYEDGLHFSARSAPVFWSWWAPQLQQATAS